MNRKAKIIIITLSILLLGSSAYYYFVLRLERVTIYNSVHEEIISPDPFSDESFFEIPKSCNVFGINLHGDLLTYSVDSFEDVASAEDIFYYLDQVENNSDYKNIKAVILEIDSYGGSPVAAEELANKIKEMSTPVIIMIRGAAVSGGYWVASAGDHVIASKLSDIGGIGVTMSYLDESKLNENEGYTWNSLSTGKFKDAGSDQKPLTKEERALFERDLKIIHEQFVSVVSQNRGLSIDKVNEIADGSTMLGKMALENGLIDEIGYINEAKNYIKNKLSIEPEICW